MDKNVRSKSIYAISQFLFCVDNKNNVVEVDVGNRNGFGAKGSELTSRWR